MFQRLQRFIFVWPGDENLQTGFNGDVIVVPPRDKEAVVGIGSPYRYEGAKDEFGQTMPGTIVISDRIEETGHAGGYRKLFDAAECCAWMEDTREDLFNRGFAIVMDPADVAGAMEEGRPKYDRSQESLAREILASELERRKKWDSKGVPPPPSSSEHKVRWAVAHLEAVAESSPMLSDDALKKVLSGRILESLPREAPAEAPVQPKEMLGSVPKEDAVEALPVTELWEMAQAAGITPVKSDMAKLLNRDPVYRAQLLSEIAEKQEGERVEA